MAIGSTNALGISGMVFKGATSIAGGRKGLVIAPETGDEKKALLGNGEFGDVTIPVASNSVLGGVKIGNTLSIDSVGTLNYNLPTATDSVKGGVKLGEGFSVDSLGGLKYTMPTASSMTIGGVKVGNTLTITGGTLDYNLPTASSSVKGGVLSSTVAGGVKVNSSGAMEVNPATTWGLLKLDSVGYYTDWEEETVTGGV